MTAHKSLSPAPSIVKVVGSHLGQPVFAYTRIPVTIEGPAEVNTILGGNGVAPCFMGQI